MKAIPILLMVLLLSACSVISEFDNNEYAALARLVATAEVIRCDDPTNVRDRLDDLELEAQYLVTYTTYRSKNVDTISIAEIIQSNVKEMQDRYASSDPSPVYCKVKKQLLIDGGNEGLAALETKR